MNYLESDLWNRLRATPPKGEALTARLAFPEISPRLLAGIDSTGYRHFLLPLSSGEDELTDNQSRGIAVTCKDLSVKDQTQDPESARYMDIICQDNAGHEAFDVIGHEIAVSLTSGENSTSEVVRGVLSKWRRFWGQIPKSILSYEETIGLFAELWFLNYWLLPHMDIRRAVLGWRGPYGGRHDFEWKEQSVEVKATTSTRGRIHRIHGLDQLSPPEGGTLTLFSLRLREEGGATNTLPRIIESLRTALEANQEALTKFENSLAMTGYSPLHDEEYEKICLRIIDEVLFTVKDPFPRITTDKFQGGIPPGIEVVDYEINLDGYDALSIARKPVQAKNLWHDKKQQPKIKKLTKRKNT